MILTIISSTLKKIKRKEVSGDTANKSAMGLNLKDRSAFKAFYELHFNPLCNYIYRITKDWELAYEIVQKTFVNFWEKRNNITDRSAAKSYLYTTARNNALDQFRRNKVDKDREDAFGYMVNNSNHDFTEDDALYWRERIMQALKELKPKNRKIFELHKFEGLTYEEIANHLDISKRAVEDNMARALKKLKIILTND